MFTGLIEAVGRVASVRAHPDGHRLSIETLLSADLTKGDSIAVNGACLTVVDQTGAGFSADVSPETLRVTTLGEWVVGRRVNLERPLRAEQRLGGHFVLGHVDAVTDVTGIRADGTSYWMEFGLPFALRSCVIPKGSVTLDGISLTIASLGDRDFAVQIVPHTWTHTALSDLTSGASVNIEADVLGKYVARMLSLQNLPEPGPAWRIE
ncbi:MAG: riboflavin synthase [Vicinamibacterales bacterium]